MRWGRQIDGLLVFKLNPTQKFSKFRGNLPFYVVLWWSYVFYVVKNNIEDFSLPTVRPGEFLNADPRLIVIRPRQPRQIRTVRSTPIDIQITRRTSNRLNLLNNPSPVSPRGINITLTATQLILSTYPWTSNCQTINQNNIQSGRRVLPFDWSEIGYGVLTQLYGKIYSDICPIKVRQKGRVRVWRKVCSIER